MADPTSPEDVLPTQQQIQEIGALPGKGASWSSRNASDQLLPGDRAQLLADQAALERRIDGGEASLAHSQEQLYSRWNAEEGPLNTAIAQAEHEEADFASRPPTTQADKLVWKPPRINADELNGFSSALIAMSLIGGIVSGGNWDAAITPMVGALQGFVDGNKEAAERNFKEYQIAYKTALDHDKAVQKEFEDVLRAKNLSINQMIREVQTIATRYGREDMRLAAQQRSIDSMIARKTALDTSLANMERLHESTSNQLSVGFNTATKTAKQQAVGGELTQQGLWLEANLLVNGSPYLANLTHSKYSSPAMYDVVNDIAQYFAEHPELDPSTISANKASLAVGQSVLRNVQNRRVAVERLTDSIKGAEEVITRLTAKVNSHGMDWQNASFNWLSRNFGHDPDVIALRQWMWTVGTQYTEATTMPGSNAQLHATVQQDMVAHFNPNFNLGHMMGLFQQVNGDIQLVDKALRNSEAEVRASMARSTVQIPMIYFMKPSDKPIMQKVIAGIPDNGYDTHPPDAYWHDAQDVGPVHAPAGAVPAAPSATTPAGQAPLTNSAPAAAKDRPASPEEAAAFKYRD